MLCAKSSIHRLDERVIRSQDSCSRNSRPFQLADAFPQRLGQVTNRITARLIVEAPRADDEIPGITRLGIRSNEHEQRKRPLLLLELLCKLLEVRYQSVLIHVSTPFGLSRIALRISSA